MKRILLLSVAIFMLNFTICSAAYYMVSMIEPIENSSLKYENEDIHITFILPPKNPQRLFMSLYNKTDETIEINWANVALIFNGKSYTVLTGTQLSTRLTSMKTTTTIPPKTRYEESVYIEKNLEYIEQPGVFTSGFGGYRHGWGGWVHVDDIFSSSSGGVKLRMKPFFPKYEKELISTKVLDYEFGLFLPLASKDAIKDYRFNFKINRVSTDISPGFLGVLAVDKDELVATNAKESIDSGVLIISVAKKGAAVKSGLLEGDNIIAFDNVVINDINDFVNFLYTKNEKDVVKVTYLRNGKKNNVEVKLGKY